MTRFVSEVIFDRVKQGVAEQGLRPYARNTGLPVGVIRSVLDRRDLSASSIEQLCNALDVNVSFGKPPSPTQVAQWVSDTYGEALDIGVRAREVARALGIPNETEIDGTFFALIDRYDVSAAAGGGYINFNEEPVDRLAFSSTWLEQNGIQAGSCSLISAFGKSMEPSIWDGDLIMIDHQKTEIHNRRIYVYNDPENGTRVKRLELGADVIAVHSDNPDKQEFSTEYHSGDAMNAISQSIIGEVVWSGHKW